MEKNTNITIKQPDTVVVTSVDVLKQAFDKWADDRERQHSASESDVLLDETQVMSILHVSHTTLWRWHNSQILVPLKLSGKNRYRKSDVLALMTGELPQEL